MGSAGEVEVLHCVVQLLVMRATCLVPFAAHTAHGSLCMSVLCECENNAVA